MDPQAAANVALIGVVAKVAFGYVRKWWCKIDYVQRYVELADVEVKCADIGIDLNLTLDDVTVSEIPNISEPTKTTRKAKHGLFKSYLVQKGKAKFGTPMRSPANLMVVRKYLHDICVEAGLIPRHILQHLDISVELVFIHSRQEITALAIHHTNKGKMRSALAQKLGGAYNSTA
jgi:hypothetical protein